MLHNFATTMQNFMTKFWKLMELLIVKLFNKFNCLKTAISSIAIHA